MAVLSGNCRLRREERELVESHIFPKFVFRWIKEGSTGQLVHGDEGVVQDYGALFASARSLRMRQ